jgi:hypothetical protein
MGTTIDWLLRANEDVLNFDDSGQFYQSFIGQLLGGTSDDDNRCYTNFSKLD